MPIIKDRTDLRIRSYEPRDEAGVVRLWKACGLVVPHNDPYKDIRRKLRVNPEWFLVGKLDRELVATCMAGYDGHRGWINYLAVDPSYRRRGYAKHIMQIAESKLRAGGCPKINLQVRATNQSVIDFYQRIGFTTETVVNLGKRLDPDN